MIAERVGSDRIDLDDAERPALTGDRGRDHRAEAGALVEGRVLRPRREQRREIVTRDHHPVLGDGDARGALPHGYPEECAFLVAEAPTQPVVVGPAQVARVGIEQVEDRALPADETARELDHLLEDLGRVTERCDPRGDLAQRLLGVRPARQIASRAIELLS